jgi:uncharacterized protein YraI
MMVITALVALFAVTPLWAQDAQPVWRAEYFNNIYFLNPPALQRFEARITYDWGMASPAAGVQTDNFSARWGGDINLSQGTYRFYVMADDEVKVTLDYGLPLIDTFGNARVGQTLSQDVNLVAGVHHIQIDYREFTGAASIFFSFESLNDGAQGPSFVMQPPAPPPPTVPATGDPFWTAEYFNNRDLSGTPLFVTQENDPSHNWGEGSPDPRISNSDFSVRWTRNIATTGGVFRVRAIADDGVRVFVDNTLILNEWHISTGEIFIKDFSLSTGVHNFRVEYMEVGGLAYLDFKLTGNTPPPSNVPAAATVTINIARLNVRNGPSPFNTVLTKVSFGETFQVVGINPTRTWVQINVNGTIGWVSARLVVLNNAANVPVTGQTPPVASTGNMVLADRFSVNIRTGPSTTFNVIGTLRLGQQAQLVGRNAGSTWWQVNYNGVVGWVSAAFTSTTPGVNIVNVPVTR